MIRLQRILLPTDFSEFADEAAKYACTLAAHFNAEIHRLYVVEERPVFVSEYGVAWHDFLQQEEKAAAERLQTLVDPDRQAGRRSTAVLRKGIPFAEIVRYARDHDIDLIVLGTHGRTGLAHMLIGSVAERVVRKAPCPVLTVRPAGHQFVMP